MNAELGVEAVEQTLIGLCGALAVFLSQDSRLRWRRWACIFGLVAQPFWFDMAWRAHEYGVLALSLVYAASWARGLAAHWLVHREIDYALRDQRYRGGDRGLASARLVR